MRRDRILVTGATGFIGGLLARRLLDDGYAVRCLVRDPEDEAAAASSRALGCEIAVADLTRPSGLAEALEGVRAAYFLVHMIGDGEDYPAIERAAAARFGRAAPRGRGRADHLPRRARRRRRLEAPERPPRGRRRRSPPRARR